MRRTETPEPIWITFCLVVDIPEMVTYTTFGDHRLRGFWLAGVIDFHRRPYNTLPCERVMQRVFVQKRSAMARANKGSHRYLLSYSQRCQSAAAMAKVHF